MSHLSCKCCAGDCHFLYTSLCSWVFLYANFLLIYKYKECYRLYNGFNNMHWHDQFLTICLFSQTIYFFFFFLICWRRKYYLYVFINKDCVCTTTPVFFISLANLSTYLSYTHSLSFYKLGIFLNFSSCVGFHDFLQDLDLPFLINMLEFEYYRDVLCK